MVSTKVYTLCSDLKLDELDIWRLDPKKVSVFVSFVLK